MGPPVAPPPPPVAGLDNGNHADDNRDSFPEDPDYVNVAPTQDETEPTPSYGTNSRGIS